MEILKEANVVTPPEIKQKIYLRCCRRCGEYHKAYTRGSKSICDKCCKKSKRETYDKIRENWDKSYEKRLEEETFVEKVRDLFGDDVNSLFLA